MTIAAHLTCFAHLDSTGCLRFEGPDAAAFLQGQLSNDVATLAIGDAQWTSYNSPKGRMLASMLLWRASEDVFRAFVASDLAETLRKRLAMFVLRAKVKVNGDPLPPCLIGMTGTDAPATALRVVREARENAPDVARAGGPDDAIAVVTSPDGRALIVAPGEVRDLVISLLTVYAHELPGTHWAWSGIAAGIPTITAATQDQFVPQAVNWDIIGGVSFKKGCFPGQEIVARMRYLGKLKERLYRLHHAGDAPLPGTALYSTVFGDQVCGTVVNAAPAPSGGADLLAVVQIAAVAEATLHLGAPDGPALGLLELPYTVLPQVAPDRPKLT